MKFGPGVIRRMMFLPAADVDDGLADIDMPRLQRVVALAGRNGAGKTRLLQRIGNTLGNDAWRREALASALKMDNGAQALHRDVATSLAPELSVRRACLWADLPDDRTPQLMPISSTPPTFNEFVDASRKAIQTHSTPAAQLGSQSVALLKIGAACNAYIAATSTAIDGPKSPVAKERFNDLRDRIRRTLGTTLNVKGVDDFRLFERPSDKISLSDGQRRLLSFTVSFWDYRWARPEPRPVIVTMDEPENYLHPDALIEMFDGILRLDDGLQIFLATHSLPLLAHIGVQATWFVQNGRVTHGGKRAAEIVESLLGGSDNVGSLQQYLAEPANFELVKFTAECLLPPETRAGKGGDPQAAHIGKVLGNLHAEKDHPLRVVDWGAGQGRLLAELIWLQSTEGRPLRDRIDYVAYDTSDNDDRSCRSAIESVYGDAAGRYFSTLAGLQALPGSVDVAILCNVLHEISPKEWPKTLQAIGELLAKDGFLLIAEDLLLPEGEQAFDAGFALLPFAAIQSLFGGLAARYAHPSSKYDDRLVVYTVPQAGLLSVDAARVKTSLKVLKEQSLETVKKLKMSTSRDWETGHRYAVASQSIVSAELALAELE